MTCIQLGGACNKTFSANTFKEIVEQSKKHGMEMFQSGDEKHLEAMKKIQNMMQSPDKMTKWFEDRKKEFENLSED